MNAVKTVAPANFSTDVLQSPLPVLVDFYADWCGPCRVLAPTLDRLADEFAGRVRVVKVNVDQAPRLAEQFDIASIPTLLFLFQGKVVGRTAGLVGEAALRHALQQWNPRQPEARHHVG